MTTGQADRNLQRATGPAARAKTGAPDPAQDPWPRRSYAWYACAILLLAYGLAILDRVAMGIVVEPMKRDLHLSDTQIGVLQGFAFAIFYSLFGLPIGVVVDRWRRNRLAALAIAIWSAATAWTGLARSFSALFAARIVVGAGESGLLPAATSLLSDYFPPTARPRAMSIFMLGGAIGGGLSSLFVAGAIQLAAQLRASGLSNAPAWQLSFLIMSAPGMVVAALAWATVREPPRRERAARPALNLAALVRQFRRQARAYGAVIVGGVVTGAAVAAQFAWWPTVFVRVHGWTPSRTGVVLALVSLPCAIASPLTAGFLMSRLGARGRRDGPIIAMLGQSLTCMVFGTAMALAPSPEIAFGLFVFVGVTGIWSMTGALTALAQITPNELRGQVVAVHALINGLVGYAFGGASVGLLTDHVFRGPHGLSPALAVVFFGCGAVASAALLFGRAAFGRAAENPGPQP